jgi:hypothetical protein
MYSVTCELLVPLTNVVNVSITAIRAALANQQIIPSLTGTIQALHSVLVAFSQMTVKIALVDGHVHQHITTHFMQSTTAHLTQFLVEIQTLILWHLLEQQLTLLLSCQRVMYASIK